MDKKEKKALSLFSLLADSVMESLQADREIGLNFQSCKCRVNTDGSIAVRLDDGRRLNFRFNPRIVDLFHNDKLYQTREEYIDHLFSRKKRGESMTSEQEGLLRLFKIVASSDVVSAY